ncbi:putative DNA-binding transcriptional regulator [Alcanivorax hongdengensis A-11-3]|uniref:Putative DNA-binding transcriptional regulator n=1 Tax=Alcanivorax hongdengensis A-11-3 TaxID=1177179 RepID=L0W9Z0_9GAMM|nr:LysR substrate-binding domain-containing protein [Alcanivorax hongdengensis]EKF73786.1 putative DNA-binding transcriptional regulator [Alcanivorax hongdengensis A-11-3]
MNALTLKQLRAFVQVAEQGSIARAAGQLSLTQPAVSLALKELEQQLGVALFDRIGRGLVINQHGERLLPQARATLAEAAGCEALFVAPPVNLSLVATHTVGNYYLPFYLGAFRQTRPEARLRVEVVNTRAAVERLLSLQADLALVEGPVSHPMLACQVWREDTLQRVATPALLRQLPQQSQRWPWVMRETGSGTRAVLETRLGKAFPPQQQIIELGSAEAIRQAVLAGAGVGYISTVALRSALADGRLATVPGERERISRPLFLVRHRERTAPPGLAALEALLMAPPGDA